MCLTNEDKLVIFSGIYIHITMVRRYLRAMTISNDLLFVMDCPFSLTVASHTTCRLDGGVNTNVSFCLSEFDNVSTSGTIIHLRVISIELLGWCILQDKFTGLPCGTVCNSDGTKFTLVASAKKKN